MPLGVGQEFAGYTVVRRLGAGGMGEVYLAQHPRLPRRDALKLLNADISADPTFRERFLREANLASTLWHPHVVGVLDRGEHDGKLWIAMDFVDGEDAASLLARRYPAGMPADLVSAIVTAVASALDHAHKRGLLHRDVKPANILLTDDVDDDGQQRILLTDFGIARTIDDPGGLTETNMTVGTVDYTAPEQLMGNDLDGRTDQYALAATAFHLLTGAPPFRDPNPTVVISRHLNNPAPPLSGMHPDLAGLDEVLATGLAKDPDERYSSCSTFARALAAAKPTVGSEKTRLAPTMLAPTRKKPAKRVDTKVETTPPSLLAPGWYPDPSGRQGTLYWDGQQWRTASIPESVPAASTSAQSSRWSTPVVAVLGLLAIVVVGGAFALVSTVTNQRGETAQTAPAPVTVTSRVPTEPVAAEPATTTTPAASPTNSTTTIIVTPAPTATQSALPAPGFRNGLVVGTCDEGGSCGVKQRIAPYTDSERLYPNDLKDGTAVTVVCQTTGDLRSNAGKGSSYVWYRLYNGAYINAVYVSLQEGVTPSC
ncbi:MULTISPECIES: protein kinase domain-containing protein [Mycolicibacterium]|uniref:protein kinase domain-containing protein n=1 Tax=Mycolicibacterium TaxID=1866885 RepID=UPI0009BF6EE6|nr:MULTISPECIES: protein kinase [Mycolicibacterium]MCW1821683.1 protein kinase [Mycolicibacterium senegalense]